MESKKVLLLLLLPVVLILGNSTLCYANSPPPPSIFIIVPNAPKDLILSIGSEEATRRDIAFESHYAFYFGFEKPIPLDNLQIATNNNTYEIIMPSLSGYNNIFTLDLATKRLTPGSISWRPYEFAAITLVSTLIIEGVIFFLFGYRKKASWIVFLITNLITQGLLYFWLNITFYPLVNFYAFPLLLSLVFGEFLVFIIEIIAFLLLLKERSRWITASYVVIANLASLFVGGFLINALM